MNSRAFYNKSNCSSRGYSVVVTRQVNVSFVPIVTSVQGNNYSETVQYSRIRVETLNQDTLRKAFEKVNDKYPSVIDLGSHYGYQYCNKPSIFISKADGRIYGEKDDYLTRLQAIFCLQKLNKLGLVEGFKRIQKHPRNRTILFLEKTSFEVRADVG